MTGVRSIPSKPGRRRFTLFDASVLVVPAAIAFFAIRFRHFAIVYPSFSDWERSTLPFNSVVFYSECLAAASWLLAVYSPTLLLLRLRKPRPRLRRLALQPGSAVLLVATLAVALASVSTTLGRVLISLHGDSSSPMITLYELTSPIFETLDSHVNGLAEPVGFGVVCVWLILATSRRGRPERSWIDRAGCFVGSAWVVLALNQWVLAHWSL